MLWPPTSKILRFIDIYVVFDAVVHRNIVLKIENNYFHDIAINFYGTLAIYVYSPKSTVYITNNLF
jgi:hypothetical protein